MSKPYYFQIDYQCPQCGAPTVIEEADRLIQCDYCKVKSYLIEKNYFRYRFEPGTSKNAELVYFPYWRFKGMIFLCFQGDIKFKFVDISYQAATSPFFPMSLGLRSQALKLKFVSYADQGHFIHPTLSLKDFRQILENRYHHVAPTPALETAVVGENLSMIYVPYYISGDIIDAILNEPVCQIPDDNNPPCLPGGKPSWGISILPTLCPSCGWDLTGEKDTLILNCANCHTLWQPSEKGMRQMPTAFIETNDDNQIFLPYWRIRADISGIPLQSYADMVRLANLPKIIPEHWENIPFYFWIPAFKISPQQFLRLGTNMTVNQPQNVVHLQLPEGRRYPVTLPVTEAVDILKINLASFGQPRKIFRDQLPNIKVHPKTTLLVYVPFTDEPHEYIQKKFMLTVNKNLLGFSKYL